MCLRWRGLELSIALVVSLSPVACSRNGTVPHKRPAGVPEAAIWAGGMDGGSFILCEVDSGRDVNTCRVWNDQSGGLEESGDYRLLKEGRAATSSELKYVWADRGGRIGLQNGLILENLDRRNLR
jgi:hypothetical protein